MNLELGQVLTQILAFLIMLWILKRFAWGPLIGLLQERQDKIRAEFAKIESKKTQISDLHRAYEERLKNIDNLAKKKGQKEIDKARVTAKEILDDAQKKANDIALKAHKSAEKEASAAKEMLKGEVVKLAIAATEALIKKKLDEKSQRELIAQYIDEAKLE